MNLASNRSLEVLGVRYEWRTLPDGGELFLTELGRPLAVHLEPANWFAPDWFLSHRQRLLGTSTICRVATRPVAGKSHFIVVRYNRFGTRVPLDTDVLCAYPNADFNSPFEEVAHVLALRAARPAGDGRRVITKRPLGIYSPPQRFEPWQLGRTEDKIAAVLQRHPEAPLDTGRQYLLLYSWIRGQDAEQMTEALNWPDQQRLQFFREIMELATEELRQCGFRMLDIKPAHCILRGRHNGQVLRDRRGRPVYALVDYELLQPAASGNAPAPLDNQRGTRGQNCAPGGAPHAPRDP
ncbi:hypothetical protein NXS98_16175 [Fontisphaera persica]|uniref:hypothetical protein n=1 Tax=Fontisphaera persica TaxID=2974023 RepID=UPI0024BFA15B|nr:hypothetical protein [Fontisphaera persica]WCJ59235.1 hypothetical protein NXS98_16175 [Fontisphaera persica]